MQPSYVFFSSYMVSCDTSTKILSFSLSMCSLIKIGNWIWKVLLIWFLGVLMRMIFNDLTVLFLRMSNRLCYLKTVNSFERIQIVPLVGQYSDRSLIKLAAIQIVMVSPINLSIGVCTCPKSQFFSVSASAHLIKNSLALTGIFSASSVRQLCSIYRVIQLLSMWLQKLTELFLQLNISRMISMNFSFLLKTRLKYSSLLLYLRIFIARNFRTMRCYRYSRLSSLSSYLTKTRPIYECSSMSVIFQIIEMTVQKHRKSLSIPTSMPSNLVFSIFLGSWAALCSHQMISCQMGIPHLTTSTIKFRISMVLAVELSYIVLNLFLAYSSAALIIIGLSSGQFSQQQSSFQRV